MCPCVDHLLKLSLPVIAAIVLHLVVLIRQTLPPVRVLFHWKYVSLCADHDSLIYAHMLISVTCCSNSFLRGTFHFFLPQT